MKIVGILDSDLTPGYNEGVKKMRKYRNDYFIERGIQLIVVNIDFFDIDKGVFTCYKSQGGKFDVIHEEIMPKTVWIRTSKDYIRCLTVLQGKTSIFPSSLVIELANDKRHTYKYLKVYQPKTILLSDALDDISKLDDMGERYVLKPRKGYGGEGVLMVEKEILDRLKLSSDASNYILQKLCDFSGGYPGIAGGNHDLRLVYIGGNLSYSEIRTNDNDFRVNVSQGGKAILVDINEIPTSLKEIADECIEKLGGGKSGVVGFDFGYDLVDDRRVLIEVNYSPGFANEELYSNKESVDLAFSQYAKYFSLKK